MKKAIMAALFVSFMPVNAIDYTQKDRDILIEIRAKMHEIDKRFEQIDKRFDFQQNILIVMLAALIGSPFLVEYLARRRETLERQTLDEARRAVIALRELAQKDQKIANALKVVGLL